MRFKTRIFVATALAALVALAVPVAAPAATGRPLQTAIYPGPPGAEPEAELDLVFRRIRLAGAHAVRLNLQWSAVAPIRRVAGFDASNPADPNYDWGWFDRQVVLAKRNQLEPIVTVAFAPMWAQQGGGLPQGNVRVDVRELARFARAAAVRYSGSYAALPRVRYWMAWNEPNLNHYIEPQLVNGRLVSADRYRRMLNGFALAVHSVHRDNVVVAGGLSPFTISLPHHTAVGPLRFMRALLCMSDGTRPRPTCRFRARFDVWAHHPYTSGGPTHHAFRRDDVSLGDLPEMRRLLLAAVKARRVISTRPVEFWVTEFSWDTKPPDTHPRAVPYRLHARWVSEALYRMWTAGVSLVTWFTLRDGPYPMTGVQSGLYFNGGRSVTRDVPKLSLTAFRFPFVAFRERRGTLVWGRTPSGKPGRVAIEQRLPRAWRTLAAFPTDRNGIFRRRLRRALPIVFRVRGSAPPTPPASYRQTVLSDAPTSYWRLSDVSSGTARDETGARHGVYGRGMRTVAGALRGQADRALAFDGRDDLVVLGVVPTPRTIELWIKTRAADTIAAFSNRDPLHRYVYFAVWGGLAHLFQNVDPFHIFSIKRINDNRWHHVVYTHDGSTGKLYVDGELQMTRIWESAEGGARAFLGYDVPWKRFFSGALDEVALYDHALTEERVREHFLASGRMLARDPDIGSLRARIVGTDDASVPFSLRRPADRFIIPFGGGGS